MVAAVFSSTVPTNLPEPARGGLRALDFEFPHYTIVLFRWHNWDYRQRCKNGRLRSSQLEARLATAQLQPFKMHLHPHFLFKKLPSISELVHDDPGQPEVPLADEFWPRREAANWPLEAGRGRPRQHPPPVAK